MIQLEDILLATGGVTLGAVFSRRFDDFCYDSRIVNPGELFVALRTEKGDGHDYIDLAHAAGALGVLVERPVDLEAMRVTCVVVPDTQAALRHWAGYIMRQFGTQVVAVAGSCGKTTTKEAVAVVLSQGFRVFKSFDNYNDRLGLPITLGKLQAEDEIAVLEMAADSFGEIAELCSIAPPRIGVITNINHTQFGYLGSLDAIAQETGQVIAALPEDGIAVLCADDERVRAMGNLTKAKQLLFGRAADADLRADNTQFSLDGSVFDMRWGDQTVQARLRLLGWPGVYASLAATAVGLALGLPLSECVEALEGLEPLRGRLRLLPGSHGQFLIDDTFSASPASVLAALDVLELAREGRKIFVLGDMTKLGRYETEGYRQIGRRIAQVADFLITKGSRAEIAATEARRAGLAADRVFGTESVKEAAERAGKLSGSGDVVLVKGSSESRLEQVVEQLILEQDRVGDLLVRQNEGWKQVVVVHPERPTWVEIDVGAIAHNTRRLKEIVGPNVEVMAILKADGYGHGALRTARTVLNNGASRLGVACLSEAVALRDAGIAAPILVLGYTPPSQARELVLHGVSATVFGRESVRSLSRAALALRSSAAVHLKIDTGMGRLGVLPEQAVDLAVEIARLPGIVFEGLFTHFAQADGEDAAFTLEQLDRFEAVLDQLARIGIRPCYVHAANSAATLRYPRAHFSLVRPGIALYGLDPSAAVRCPADFRPALSFKTQIAQIKTLPPGAGVSYGSTYRLTRHSRIAVLPVGYGDGFRRSPRNWGDVLVRGRQAPLVGTVCMDQCMVDVTDIPDARQGDEVVLIGEQGGARLSAEEVARRLGTINYEVISELLARVPRLGR